ncbi:MAG TPA: hypothetical protein VEK08_08470 [Planctomycetota bacterium]|nr:hypothetical protein [Planctomycetota bacterium]
MKFMRDNPAKVWLLVGAMALVVAGFVQNYVERRRKETNLTWAEADKNALEVGFLALGGFRGILADVLWIRAVTHQDSARYYELKLLCDMILKLQPTFIQVHAFQAYNMSYNLAYRAETCEDKWYWIRSGLATLEKGLERNSRNYGLWFELGYQYFDRLGETKMGECAPLRDRELPRLSDLSEEQRQRVWLGEKSWSRPPVDSMENLRFASYYFWKAMQTGTDPVPIRTERQYGQCIERLGHWYSKKPEAERKEWDDWGSEEWWVELLKREKARGTDWDKTVENNLRFNLYQQMDTYVVQAARLRQTEPARALEVEKKAQEAYARFNRYFPANKDSMEQLLKIYRDHRERISGYKKNMSPQVVPPHP